METDEEKTKNEEILLNKVLGLIQKTENMNGGIRLISDYLEELLSDYTSVDEHKLERACNASRTIQEMGEIIQLYNDETFNVLYDLRKQFCHES